MSTDYGRAVEGYVEIVRSRIGDLLDVADLGVDENLFSVGGDSMSAIKLAWRLAEETGLHVDPAEDIMLDATARAIGERLAMRSVSD